MQKYPANRPTTAAKCATNSQVLTRASLILEQHSCNLFISIQFIGTYRVCPHSSRPCTPLTRFPPQCYPISLGLTHRAHTHTHTLSLPSFSWLFLKITLHHPIQQHHSSSVYFFFSLLLARSCNVCHMETKKQVRVHVCEQQHTLHLHVLTKHKK